MTSKSASLLIPGAIFLVIGFLLFGVLGSAIGLIVGLVAGEMSYQHNEF